MAKPVKPATAPHEARALHLVAAGDMRIEIVKREINQGALAGRPTEISDYAAALVIAALDSYDEHFEQRIRQKMAVEIMALLEDAPDPASALIRLGGYLLGDVKPSQHGGDGGG